MVHSLLVHTADFVDTQDNDTVSVVDRVVGDLEEHFEALEGRLAVVVVVDQLVEKLAAVLAVGLELDSDQDLDLREMRLEEDCFVAVKLALEAHYCSVFELVNIEDLMVVLVMMAEEHLLDLQLMMELEFAEQAVAVDFEVALSLVALLEVVAAVAVVVVVVAAAVEEGLVELASVVDYYNFEVFLALAAVHFVVVVIYEAAS